MKLTEAIMIDNPFSKGNCWFFLKRKIICRFSIVLLVRLGWVSGPVIAQELSRQDPFFLSFEDKKKSILDLKDFLSIPNYGGHAYEVYTNIEWCVKKFEALDFKVERLETNGMPLLMAEKKLYPDRQTVLFYLQIDGQPVDQNLWDQESPYKANLKELVANEWKTIEWHEAKEVIDSKWHLFARSASDAKGPAMALIQALELLKNERINPEFNVKVIMDFQEELGSPDLPDAVSRYSEKFLSDYLIIMDGVRSVANVPTLTFGARGSTSLTLTVFGPRESLHSGHYGNYAPNPVFTTSHLLSSMKDEDGKVLIPGFYKGVEINDQLKKDLDKIPEHRDKMLRTIGIAEPEEVGRTYQESLQYPSLNIRGISGGWTGDQKRTIIPSEVVVEFDMRSVTATPAERQIELIKRHIQTQGFVLVEDKPTDEQRMLYSKMASLSYSIGSKPFVTPFGETMDGWLSSAVKKATGTEPLKIRLTGGSQPIAPFINVLGIPAVAVRLGNPDSNIHAPNENIQLGNYFEGIRTCIAILTESLIGYQP